MFQHPRLRFRRPSPAPLTLAIGLALCAPAFASEVEDDASKRDPAKDVDAVIVGGQRNLPDYFFFNYRGST